MKKQAVGQVLQVRKRLALPAYQPARIVRFDIQKDAVVKMMLLHGGFKSKQFQELRQGFFGLGCHNVVNAF
jgi:hypothetical protein